MRFLLSILAVCLPFLASAQDWNIHFYNYANGAYVPQSAISQTAVAQFDFRVFNTYTTAPYLAGPLTTTAAGYIGDLRWTRVTVRAHVIESGGPVYLWRAYNTWNPPPRLANFRLFFCTNSAPFNINTSNGDPLSYWWSTPAWAQLDACAGGVTLTADFAADEWTAAHGQSSRAETNAFNAAVAHVGQIGVMFSGGRFYDVGVAITNNLATATFFLDSFELSSALPGETTRRSDNVDNE